MKKIVYFMFTVLMLLPNVSAVDLYFGGSYTREVDVNLSDNISVDITWSNLVQYGNATFQYGIHPSRGNDLYDDENEMQNKSWRSFITVWDGQQTFLDHVELVNDTLTEPFNAIEGVTYYTKVHIELPSINGNYTVRFLIIATPEDTGGGSGGYASDPEVTTHMIRITGHKPLPEPQEEENYLPKLIIGVIVISLLIVASVVFYTTFKSKGEKE